MVKNYPVLFAAFAQAALALVISLGFSLTAAEVGGIEAGVAAAVALVVALWVDRPTVAVVTGFLNAVIMVAVAFGVPRISAGLTSVIDAVVVSLAAFFVHSNVSPATRAPAPVGVPMGEPRRM